MGRSLCIKEAILNTVFRENDMELMKGGVTLPNVDEKGSPEAPVDQYGHPTEFERSKSTCQKYIGQLMWLAKARGSSIRSTVELQFRCGGGWVASWLVDHAVCYSSHCLFYFGCLHVRYN